MKLRTLAAGIVLPLFFGTSALALSVGDTAAPRAGAPDSPPPVQLAQVSDPQVTELQEQVRRLNGQIEELNFQILQMQEQMRRMQEDNEFRFQELEKHHSGASGESGSQSGRALDEDIAPPDDEGATLGEPERTFGTITLDEEGNIRSSSVEEDSGQPVDLLDGETLGPAPDSTDEAGTDGTAVAALPPADSADELYRNAYDFILSGDYRTAEAGFREHIERYPDSDQAPDAHFWLGEALLGQQEYREAAQIFLTASKDYPQAKKAPDMLYKLGMSLVAMDQRDVACATFDEVASRYPDASQALIERVNQERARASC